MPEEFNPVSMRVHIKSKETCKGKLHSIERHNVVSFRTMSAFYFQEEQNEGKEETFCHTEIAYSS